MKLAKYSLLIGVAACTVALDTPAQAQAGTQYLGQISAFGFNFCPRDWANADGALLPINQNQALFAILGTTYGGDGVSTFALPDLRGRMPIGDGNAPGLGTYVLGQAGGSTSFTLTTSTMPAHNHTGTVAASSTTADTNIPVRNSFGASTGTNAYLDGSPAINNMNADTLRINNTGNNIPVNKVSPYQTINWCIAQFGIFPSRS